MSIILSSTNPGDVVLDPFAGSGTTLVVASQLNRKSIGIELDSCNVKIIRNRLAEERKADNVSRFLKDYSCTEGLEGIWAETISVSHDSLVSRQTTLFEKEGSSELSVETNRGLLAFHRHQIIKGGINRFANISKLRKASEFVLSQGGQGSLSRSLSSRLIPAPTGSLCALFLLLTCGPQLDPLKELTSASVRLSPAFVGDLYRPRYSLSWWLGLPTRWVPYPELRTRPV